MARARNNGARSDTHITQLDMKSAEEACVRTLDILRALDAKLGKKLPVEPGPYELPIAAAADLKAFLKSSAQARAIA